MSKLSAVPLALRDGGMAALCAGRADGSDQGDDDIDVSACRLRVRTRLMRGVDQRLRDPALYTRQGDVETRLQEVLALQVAQVDLGVDRGIGRKARFHLRGRKSHRAH